MASDGFNRSTITRRTPPNDQSCEYNCNGCENPDSFDDMVACDFCDTWYHFCCAKVTVEIRDKEWRCPKCSARRGANKQQESIIQDIPSTTSNTTITEASQPNIQTSSSNESQLLITNQNLPLFSAQGPLQSSQEKQTTNSNIGNISGSSYHGNGSKGNSLRESKTSSCRARQVALLALLEEERELNKKRDEEYIRKKRDLLLSDINDSSSTSSEVRHSNERTGMWVEKQVENSTVLDELNRKGAGTLHDLAKEDTNNINSTASVSIPINKNMHTIVDPITKEPSAVTSSNALFKQQNTIISINNSAALHGHPYYRTSNSALYNPTLLTNDPTGQRYDQRFGETSAMMNSFNGTGMQSTRMYHHPIVHKSASKPVEQVPLNQQRYHIGTGIDIRDHLQSNKKRYHTGTGIDLTSRNTSLPWLSARDRQQFLNSTNLQNSKSRNYLPEANEIGLSMSQLAVRQVVSKDLPTFSGDPLEWPIFLSTFVRSTNLCNLSNEENLTRLRKSLKGKAYEAVKGWLIFPETIPQVLNTLRMLFGKPELILDLMSKQVSAEPRIHPENLEMLVRFSMSVQHLCAIAQACEMQEHLYNPVLLRDLVSKIPAEMKMQWAECIIINPPGTIESFNIWLAKKAELASSVITMSVSSNYKPDTRVKPPDNKKSFVNATHVEPRENTEKDNEKTSQKHVTEMKSCVMNCGFEHRLADCQKFLNLSKTERWKVVRDRVLCRKCLGRHSAYKCRWRKDCGVDGCRFKHSPLLHDTSLHATATVATTNVIDSQQLDTNKLLFRIVPVILHNNTISIKTFAFLDEGSSLTLLDDEVARKLQLEGPSEDMYLKWTGNTTRREQNSRRVSFEISGVNYGDESFKLSDVRTVKSLDLPVQSMHIDSKNTHFKHLQKIPITQYMNAKPRILIGLQHWKLGLPIEVREGDWGEPVAARTRLGWTVFGTYNHVYSIENENHAVYHICSCTPDEDLHQQVKDFFSTENFGVSYNKSLLESKEDKRARKIMESKTYKEGNKYVTGLLWRYDNIQMPNSLPMAKRRLTCLEKKLEKHPELAADLTEQLNDYISRGYARKLTPEEAKIWNQRTWYLPIFPVTNPNKPGKVRIVWDAAAVVNGVSLNSVLLKGPDLLSSLPNILQRFREYPIAISGDIKHMFHQVGILDEDQHSQRFLWRNMDTKRPPDVYIMNVMTFGATCSPSCAQYVKNLNAAQYSETNPRAVSAICQNHYVDDWLDSFQSENEAIKTAKDVIKIHANAGFLIRNFVSNSEQVLRSLGDQATDERKNLNISGEITGAKVLGMWWSTTDDSFFYNVNFDRLDIEILNGTRKPTKREVLRTLMLVYDPIGLVQFFIIFLKILLQEIWKSAITWDEQINNEQQNKWMKWTKAALLLSQLKIPRCYSLAKYRSIQMHTFVDASIYAFAAVVYFRIETDLGVHCVLVTAKAKVAPLKLMSVPRLELQAAVLGTRLTNTVRKAHTLQVDRQIFWSDSTDVLSWLRSDKRKYRQFIAFRVGEILETTNVKDWRWIPSRLNVADEGTKWKHEPQISSRSRWFVGPQFLYEAEDQWPVEKNSKVETDEELVPHWHISQDHLNSSNLIPDLQLCHNWRFARRTLAWVLRFFNRARNIIPSNSGALSPEELKAAENELFRQAQIDMYRQEILSLMGDPDKPLEKNSILYKLSPFMDENKILRMKGRITKAIGVSFDVKNPILMPRDHPITRLLVTYYHERYHHRNHETVVNEIRQRFIISKLRTMLKRIRSECQHCKNQRAKPISPQMADHPVARLASYTAPFSYVGVDFFGPFEVVVGRRVEKRYGVLFCCLTIRAIHLEIAHTLNKSSCMMVIRNFIARRGTPIEIRSDNGTNFRGVHNELQSLWENVKPDDFREQFDSIRWIFNPPSSPHMGGCWERMIKSVKLSLLAAMPSRRPDDETLRCFFMEVENIVNSRPLTYIPIDSEEEEAMTPNHFLLGSSSGSKPFAEFTDDVLILSHNWKISQQMTKHYWQRWTKEYLPELARKTKWYSKVKPLEHGDVVVVMDDNVPNSWKKGIIIDIIKSRSSDQVRQVVVKTTTGVYTRPAAKIAVLDVKTDVKLKKNHLPTYQGGECRKSV